MRDLEARLKTAKNADDDDNDDAIDDAEAAA